MMNKILNSEILNSEINKSIYIGANCFVEHSKIGKYCSLSWNLSIGGDDNNYKRILMTSIHRVIPVKDFYSSFEDEFVIGNDTWIGANRVVLRGVHIHAIIDAGSIVTHGVEPHSIVRGNPEKITGHRFLKEIIAWLLRLRIRDLPDELFSKLDKVFFEKDLTIVLMNQPDKQIKALK